MTLRSAVLVVALLTVPASSALADGTPETDTPAVRTIVERTIKLAGPEYAPVARHLCYLHSPQDKADLARRRAGITMRATKVFDDLFYVGTLEYGAWAYVTPAGIILFDALDTPENARTRIIDGLRSVGLDPARITKVIITHGHGDHFGGAAYLRRTTGASLYASAADWDVMRHTADNPQLPREWIPLIPEQDQIIKDGEQMGDPEHRIIFRITPGHTPGTVSSFFPVHDHGRRHMVALWGGVGIPTQRGPVVQYQRSASFFRSFGQKLGVDVGLTNHPHSDMALENLALVQSNPSVSPNPFISGRQGFATWTKVLEGCASAEEARLHGT